MTLTGWMSGAIWWYVAWHDRLIDPDMDRRYRCSERLAPLVIPSIFLLSIGLAFSNPDLARYSWASPHPPRSSFAECWYTFNTPLQRYSLQEKDFDFGIPETT
jgi:hypothetical protein